MDIALAVGISVFSDIIVTVINRFLIKRSKPEKEDKTIRK
jgi:hypothetical protein